MPNVVNPGFEVDLSSWGKQDANSSTTWTRDTSVTHAGSIGSSKLVQTTAAEDDYISQDIDPSFLGLNKGATYIVTAWVNVTIFTAAAIANRGLFVVSEPSTSTTPSDNITATTAGWVAKSVQITLGAADTGMEIRLYAPQGTTYWDDISLVQLPDTMKNNPIWPRIRFNG